jgi:iron complex transport system permease protein
VSAPARPLPQDDAMRRRTPDAHRTASPAGLAAVARRRQERARRTAAAIVLLGGVLVALVVASLAIGELRVPPGEVLATLSGGGHPADRLVVLELRLPRVVTGILVGVAFGVSGAVFQTLVRNPLATPDVVGVTAGAGTGAVAVIVLGGGAAAVAGGSLAGGAAATAAVYLLTRHGLSSHRLVLVGIGVSAALTSVTSYLLTRAEIFDTQRAFVWLTGSLNGRAWDHALLVGVTLVAVLPLLSALHRPLAALGLGEPIARNLGVPVDRARVALLVLGVVLASVATAAAGPVAFVAFVSAPLGSRLARSAGPALLPAALAGAVVVVAADLAARTAFGPHELPVGVLTGALGAPVLIAVLARAREVS